MLKKIPSNLSPDLLHVLASMGHGDELVLADANYPTSSTCGSGPREVRCDGQTIPQLLEAILQLLPLDTYVQHPAALMDLVMSDKVAGLQVRHCYRLKGMWHLYKRIQHPFLPNRLRGPRPLLRH